MFRAAIAVLAVLAASAAGAASTARTAIAARGPSRRGRALRLGARDLPLPRRAPAPPDRQRDEGARAPAARGHLRRGEPRAARLSRRGARRDGGAWARRGRGATSARAHRER